MDVCLSLCLVVCELDEVVLSSVQSAARFTTNYMCVCLSSHCVCLGGYVMATVCRCVCVCVFVLGAVVLLLQDAEMFTVSLSMICASVAPVTVSV